MDQLKGNLVVGQSGGCTAVINSSLVGVVEEALQQNAIGGIWGAMNGVEGVLRGELIDLRQESEEALQRLALTPASALGSCRHKLLKGQDEEIAAFCRKHNVRYFIYIGGNDSADTAHRVSAAAQAAGYQMRVVLAPKTIDNDLPVTDHCPGYGSVAKFVAATTLDAGRDTESMQAIDPVKVIETMGRNSGWIAAASALCKRDARDAPQVVWPPEAPFEEEAFLEAVQRSLDEVGFAVVVVAHSIRDAEGRFVGLDQQRREVDAFGHVRVPCVSRQLCELLDERLKVRARWEKPGSVQRMSSLHQSGVDLEEARQAGQHATRFAVEQDADDQMVILVRESDAPYRCGYGVTGLEDIANTEKHLPPDFFDRTTMLPTEAFRRYALPLVGTGLPRHGRITGPPVPLGE